MMSRLNILNTSVDNIPLTELLEKLRQGGVVYTPNVDHLVRLQRDAEFYQIYKTADYRICDSQILYWASRFLGQPIVEKISGSDLFPAFYRYYRSDETVRIFLLGAKEGVAQRALEQINQTVGREMVVQAHSPSFGFEKNEQECLDIIDLINASGANVLAIGVGAPKQEKWIFRYRDQLKSIKTFLAIGATIDFEAGNIPRSPKWASTVGLEWLYRLIREPQRLWKRYLIDDLPFLSLLIQQRLGLYRDPFDREGYGPRTSVPPSIQSAISAAETSSDAVLR
jgi:N-acetylglucosaminyldiphosphoundecaprenol N-acetyl-beta-D-mannosaminyltransferase